jgi:hypothetical protein
MIAVSAVGVMIAFAAAAALTIVVTPGLIASGYDR